ncbi:MAG: hypothetical protein GY809_20725 [Planctomycetes bacterium]|nr:hypothetical protein [Planctomycetota bacterium]
MMRVRRSQFPYLFVVFAWLGMAGCAPQKASVSVPAVQGVVKASYEIQLEPVKKGGTSFRFFLLTIVNKSEHNMQIDWHQSGYLYNGKQYGMLVSRDSVPGQVKDPDKRFEVIAARQTYKKDVAPMKLIAYATAREDTAMIDPVFSAGPIPVGKSGILLTLKQGEMQFVERITVDIVETIPEP